MSEDTPLSSEEKRIEYLRQLPLFAWLGSEHVTQLAQNTEERFYEAGATIFMRNTESNTLNLIVEGEVQFISFQGDDANDSSASSLEEGEYFGEMSLIDLQNRKADVRATLDTVLYVIRRSYFMQFAKEHPSQYAILMTNLAREMARHLRRLNVDKSAKVAESTVTPVIKAEGSLTSESNGELL